MMRIIAALLLIGCQPVASQDLEQLKAKLSQAEIAANSSRVVVQQTDRLESIKSEQPEPPPPASDEAANDAHVEPLAEPVPVEQYDIYEFTASWCGACKQFEKREAPKLKLAGVNVTPIEFDANVAFAKSFGIARIPAFVPIRRSDGMIVQWHGRVSHMGNMSAEKLLLELAKLPKQRSKKAKVQEAKTWSGSSQTLKQLIAIDRAAHPQMYADVVPRSRVWAHLVEHGWKWEDIKGLSLDDALQLHDATHDTDNPGRLKP